MKCKVGVVLSGCGYLDGAEIREAVLTLLALDANDLEAVCIAPSGPQRDVVDHQAGAPVDGERRDVLREAARIARGNVRELASVQADELSALVMPGGFGAAKNLSDFAVNGPNATVNEDLARLLRDLHAQSKPIGAICIAPAVVAAVLGKQAAPQLTIGNDAGTAEALEAMGATHHERPVDECLVDEANRIFSTPAYMYGDARLKDISTGIHALVQKLAEAVR